MKTLKEFEEKLEEGCKRGYYSELTFKALFEYSKEIEKQEMVEIIENLCFKFFPEFELETDNDKLHEYFQKNEGACKRMKYSEKFNLEKGSLYRLYCEITTEVKDKTFHAEMIILGVGLLIVILYGIIFS